VVGAALEWLRRRENNKQMLVGLALGLLLLIVAAFSTLRGDEEEYKGEVRTKSLIYDADPNGKLGLYWIDDKAKENVRKATPEEVRRCGELHPDQAVPICQTTYYEKDEDKQ
jgi:hypothetical protein